MEAPCVISLLYLFPVSCSGIGATIAHQRTKMINVHVGHRQNKDMYAAPHLLASALMIERALLKL